jgi:AraC-like DNA-binding protein
MPAKNKKNTAIRTNTPTTGSIDISIWDPLWSVKEHTSTESELVHILKGKVTLHFPGHSYKGQAGDTLVVADRVLHRDEFPQGSVFEVLHVHFSWPRTRSVFPAEKNKSLVSLPADRKKVIAREIFRLHEAFKSPGPLARELTDAHLKIVLLTMQAALEAKPASDADDPVQKKHAEEIVTRAQQYIAASLSRQITLSDVAAHLGMSMFHLSHLFSRVRGFSFSEYLMRLRMEKAAELLVDPAKRVSQIAYEIGFADANYFSKTFRKFHGVSPGEYRGGK